MLTPETGALLPMALHRAEQVVADVACGDLDTRRRSAVTVPYHHRSDSSSSSLSGFVHDSGMFPAIFFFKRHLDLAALRDAMPFSVLAHA
jgi:hypothetical protein